MIAHLNVLQDKSQMDMEDAFTIALDCQALPGMTFNNGVFVHLNMLTMAVEIVFIIMSIMDAVSQ
jgi:hypothetical protein